MFFYDFVFALVIGLVLAGVFSAGFGRTGPWASFWIFFLVVFLAAWAGGVWVGPVGPTVLGLYWVPFLFVGFLFALLLAAATPPSRRRVGRPDAVREIDGREQRREQVDAAIALEMFFWIWVGVLMILIFAWYALV